MKLDIYEKGEMIGVKTFKPTSTPLNKWVTRPKNEVDAVPLNSGLTVNNTGRVYLDKLSSNSIGYLLNVSNDIKNSTMTSVYSSVQSSGNGWSIEPNNFEETLLILAFKRLSKAYWLNWEDQFSIPDTTHPDYDQFKLDAIVWALFNGANNASSMGDVLYKDKFFDIKNEFFWLTKEEFCSINAMSLAVINRCSQDNERFVSQWLIGKTFSNDIVALIEKAKELVVLSAWARPHAETRFHLLRWDAGWYQIKMGLYGKDTKFQKTQEMIDKYNEFCCLYKEIGDRLRPYLYELGVLPTRI